MTWKILFFEEKFFRDKLNAVLNSPPKRIFTERRKFFCSMSDYEALFGTKTFKKSSRQLECIFDNPPQSFRPMLCEFYRPAKRFSTTAEKIPPNVGRRMKNYSLYRSNNDPWNVTLDMFTAIWTIPIKSFHNRATWAIRKKNLQHCRERFDEVGLFFRLMFNRVPKRKFS